MVMMSGAGRSPGDGIRFARAVVSVDLSKGLALRQKVDQVVPERESRLQGVVPSFSPDLFRNFADIDVADDARILCWSG